MSGDDGGKVERGKRKGWGCWTVFFVLLVVGCLLLGLYVYKHGFHVASRPQDFSIVIASKSGRDFKEGECLIVLEQTRELTVALPCPPEGRKESWIISVVPYDGGVIPPETSNYGVFLGPAVYNNISGFYVLARGHKFRFFDLMRIDPDVVYHENPSPKDASGGDTFNGATYSVDPLASPEEGRANIQKIRDTFQLSNAGRGNLPSVKEAELVRAFLEAEEEELERLLSEEKEQPESR